jgi:hypothetical protein
MGTDFSRVRLHTDNSAAQTAHDLDARAFTSGSNIVFGSGEYDPGSTEGRRLLAHELTHVVQQTGEQTVRRAQVVTYQPPQPQEDVPLSSETATELASQEQEEEPGPGAHKDRAREEKVAAGPEFAEQPAQTEPVPGRASTKEDAPGPPSPVEQQAPASTPEPAQEVGPPVEGKASHTGEQKAEAPTGPTAEGEQEAGESSAPAVEGEQKGEAPTGPADEGKQDEPAAEKTKDVEKIDAQIDPHAPQGEKLQGAVEQVSSAVSTAEEQHSGARQEANAELEAKTQAVADQRAEAENAEQQAAAELTSAISDLQALESTGISFAPPEQAPASGPQDVPVARQPLPGPNGDPQARAQRASQILGDFVHRSAGQAAEITASARTASQRIQPVVQGARASIQASVSENLQGVREVIEQARTRAKSGAAETLALVEAQFETTTEDLRAAKEGACSSVEKAYQEKLGKLSRLEKTTPGEVDAEFASSQTAIRQVGQEVAGKADTIRHEVVSDVTEDYAGKEGTRLQGKDYFRKKEQAAKDAAAQVTQAYQDEFTEQAETAAEQLPSGKQDVLNTINDKISGARTSLQTERNNAIRDIEQLHQQMLTTATQNKAAQLQALQQSLQATLTSLNELEVSFEEQLVQVGEQQEEAAERDARQFMAQLQQKAAESAQSLSSALGGIVSQAGSLPAPDPDRLGEVLAGAGAQIASIRAQLEASLGEQIGAAEQAVIQNQVQAGGSLNEIRVRAGEAVTPIDETFVTNMNDLLDQAKLSFEGAKTQLEEGAKPRAQTAVDQIGSIYEQCEKDVGTIKTALKGGLAQFVTDFRKGNDKSPGLEQSLAQLREDVRKEAKEAADKVQPAWKKILFTVISVVITVVVAVAIAALVASGVGLGLGLLLAAGIGALGNVLSSGFKNLAQGEGFFKDWGKSLAVGALSGALTFLGGRFIQGVAAEGFKQVLKKTGLEVAIDTAVDALATGVDMALEGTFTWGRLAQAGFTSLVVNVGSKLLLFGAEGAISKWRGRGAAPDVDVPGRAPGTAVDDVDVPGRTSANTPEWSTPPHTRSGQRAMDLGLDEPPPGHEWIVPDGGRPYLRRQQGLGPTGENIPRITYDAESGGFRYADSGEPYVPDLPRGSPAAASSQADARDRRGMRNALWEKAGEESIKQGLKFGADEATGVVYGPGSVDDQRQEELKGEEQTVNEEERRQMAEEEVVDWEQSFDWDTVWDEYQLNQP